MAKGGNELPFTNSAKTDVTHDNGGGLAVLPAREVVGWIRVGAERLRRSGAAGTEYDKRLARFVRPHPVENLGVGRSRALRTRGERDPW